MLTRRGSLSVGLIYVGRFGKVVGGSEYNNKKNPENAIKKKTKKKAGERNSKEEDDAVVALVRVRLEPRRSSRRNGRLKVDRLKQHPYGVGSRVTRMVTYSAPRGDGRDGTEES